MRPIAIAFAACGFGGVSVLAKLAYDAGAAPASLFAARVILAGLILSPFALPRGSNLTRRSLVLTTGAGVAFAAAGLLEFQALARLPASVLVTVIFTSPIWIALGSWWLRRAPPRAPACAAFGVVVVGLLLLVGGPGESTPDPVGLGLALSASFLFATVFLLIEALVGREPWARAMAGIAATAALVAGALHAGGAIGELTDPATRPYTVAVGALTATSLLALGYGMGRTSAFSAAVIAGVEPLAAALLAVLLLGESMGPIRVLGAVAVVAGVTGVSRSAYAG
jgi:drug/metabolite transporter (DMT)-like permease